VIGSRDQVVVDVEIDEAEQDNDKRRKQASHREGPSKRVGVQELKLIHPVSCPTIA
jgi:hypothetical protein